MDRKSFIVKRPCILCAVWLALPFFGHAQSLPGKKQILETMELANGYFMEKWPDPGREIVTERTRPSNIWTRAVYYEGLMSLIQTDPKPEYLDYAVRWGEFHRWGLRDGIRTRNADNQCCGQTYIDLYLMDPKPERIKDIKACIDSTVSSPKNDDWSWIDALQMAMPVFARLGVLYQDKAYFQKMYDLYIYTKTCHGTNGLYSLKDHLWWRDKDFVPPYREPNGRNCYWSRGNGWVFAALVRVLDILPPDAPHREEYLRTFKEMAGALASAQRADGYWNVSLHDSTHFGGKELTGTALFTYGMAWGVRHGHLNKKKYLPIAARAWNAMAAHSVHKNGFLGYVQGTGKEPKDGQPVACDRIPNFEDFGLGCFLLAGKAVYDL
jgi:unsaturated rhamnogalacturonyl hydrolase